MSESTEFSTINLHEKLRSLVSTLGVNSLTDHLTKEKVELLERLGLTIDSYSLAEVLVTEHGLDIFKNKALRLDLLISQDPKRLADLVDSNGRLDKEVISFNDFSWGENERSKAYLKFFDFPSNFVQEVSIAPKSEQLVEVANPLHRYQNWLRQSILEFLGDQAKSRTVVHMPTGSGKTRTCLEAICDLIRSRFDPRFCVVWFAHSEELCEQAVESFGSLWSKLGSESVNVVRLWGGNRFESFDVDKPHFVVTSFQTAYQLLKSHNDSRFELFAKIRRACSVLIVDEAHQSTAPTYQEAIELFSNRRTKIIGLTATPGRHHIGGDSEDTVELAKFYHQNKIDIVDDNGNALASPIEFLTDKGILSKLEIFQLDSGVELKLTASEKNHIQNLLDIPRSVLEQLGENEQRTNLVATQALKLVTEFKYQTIIFAPSKGNAIEIATLLRLKGCEAEAVIGDTPGAQRRNSIGQFKEGKVHVLTNFGVLTTGFDSPNIRAVIIARPTTSVVLYSQMIGRGLRGPMMGGSEDCLLINISDNITNMPDVSQAFNYYNEYFGG